MIAIGAYQLDVGRRMLVGAGGEAALSPLGSRLLQYLAEHRGEVVGREALIDALWSGNFLVGDPALNRLISETRKAAQQVGTQALIETVHKSG